MTLTPGRTSGFLFQNGKKAGDMTPNYHTLIEILSQPEAWAEALQVVHTNQSNLAHVCGKPYRQVIFTGCGSTYYLALAGAALFQELTGQVTRAAPASELLLNSPAVLTKESALLVAVSRSGSTTETLKAVELFRTEYTGPVIGVTNYGQEPLAGLCDLALVMPKGQERSVAQTRSFASMYLAVAALSAAVGGHDDLLQQMQKLPAAGERLLKRYEGLAHQYGEDQSLDRFYFLGSGARYGLACEVNLKMKEMTLTHSEPFHFLEFRHGPMSMVGQSAMVIGLLSERNQSHEARVLEEMRDLGGKTLGLAETGADIAFESGVPEAGRGVLYLPVLQLLAYYRALRKDLNPDQPMHLSSVIKLVL
jgi:glucosamine--fructose-6-phosphate aminotransferase (isomerizing)